MEIIKNDHEVTRIIAWSEGQELRATAWYDEDTVTAISVIAGMNHITPAKNPITLLRMIFRLLEEFESRNVKRVEFDSINQYNNLHENIIRSYGWAFEKVYNEGHSRKTEVSYICTKE